MSSRDQAIETLRAIPDPVLPDLPFEVVPFRPEHAEGLARLFLTIYGDAYPIDAYYIPDAIRAEQERGNVCSMVAVLEDGSIAGHMALYHSSAPFKGLLECGMGMIHPHYRSSFMLFFLFKELIEGPAKEVPALYGEAVCDTIATQHLSSLYGFMETGIELDLLPDKGEGRVSCLYQSRESGTVQRIVHEPAGLEDALAFFMDGYEPKRVTVSADADLVAPATDATVEYFEFAGVLRVSVVRPGMDFMDYVRAMEEDASRSRKGCVNILWFLNLGVPECGAAAEILLGLGCFPVGFIPRWFDDDGLLLQKLTVEPEWERLQLYSDRAKGILNRLRGFYPK